jgi:hypothetical protein
MRRGQAIVVSDWNVVLVPTTIQRATMSIIDKSDLHRPRKKRENACKVVSET